MTVYIHLTSELSTVNPSNTKPKGNNSMPNLETKLHLNMHNRGKKRLSIRSRIVRAIKELKAKDDVYGLEWGDPEISPPLGYVRDHFLMPYISSEATILEIGPGGGRWTRYMLKANHLYAIDYHQELLDELKSNFSNSNISYIKNNGDDFPSVPDESIDFLFSFGVFVHLDIDIIDQYVKNMKRLLKPGSNIVIQYSDKNKPLAKSNAVFSENDPDKMREVILAHDFEIFEEDTNTMWHSSIIRFGLPGQPL